MALILPGNVASALPTGYNVANSVRFNDGDSPRLVIANPTAGTRTKGTFSTWFKRCTFGAAQYLFSTWNNATDGYSSAMVLLRDDDRLEIDNYVASGASGHASLITERQFRDPSAWYHVCLNWDTTDGTAADRYKIYVNGVRETVFSGTPAYPPEDNELFFNAGGTANPQSIGFESPGSDRKYFDGYLAETVHIEGNALAASSFGEFNSDSPTIWQPIDVSGLTFGDEGFYLDYEDSDNLGDDESGNTNDFAETNLAAIDQTVDTPTNSFATFNPLWKSNFDNDGVYSEGNCKLTFTSANSDRGYGFSTMGVTAGKWYWEIKLPTVARAATGVGDANAIAGFDGVFYDESTSYGMQVYTDGGINENNTTTSYANSISDDDIVMFALDMDNHRCWYGINGTWQDSGDPTSGATGTGDMTTQISDQTHINTGEFIFPFVNDVSASGQADFEINFGNPPYANSSDAADANGYGAFEYAPPSGFLAMCTKNLGENGG